MTIFSRDSISSWTTERSICCQPQFFSFCNLLDESFWQCVFFQHFGQKAAPLPRTSIPYAVHTTHSFPFLSNLQYLYGWLRKQLIPFRLTRLNIRQIQLYRSNGSAQNVRTSLTQLRSDACPLSDCPSRQKLLTMAVETDTIRGPLNSVLNSARPTVCIKPLSGCFHEWQLPESLKSRKISSKQLTCKRVVKKYANMKKSPSAEFSRKLFLYSDSPCPLSPESPSSLLPTNSANNGPHVMLKEKLLNGQTSENGSTQMQEDEFDAKNTVGSISSPNGKSLHAACNLVRRKYLKYWRKSLDFHTTAGGGGEKRFLKNVRLCDVFKPGSDKCYHAQLPQNVRIPSRQHISGAAAHRHSENVPCTYSQQRISRMSRWNAEDKNIFSLLNQPVNVRNQCTKTSRQNDSEEVDKNLQIKNDFDTHSADTRLKNCLTTDPKENLPSDKSVIKNADVYGNEKLNSSSHSHSLNFLRKASSRHFCLGISHPSLDDLQHVSTCKSNLQNDPLENPYEKPSHQTCFSEDSAFSSGSSSSSSSSSVIESQTHTIPLPKVQRIKRKNGRQAPYSYNYFTNSEQEGPRIRRRRTCPCCIFPSPIKKRRRRSRTCGSDLPEHYHHFVESTLQLHSLRNKLHLFLTVLFPKLVPLLESISTESENIDHILDEAVSLIQHGHLVSSVVEELASEQSSSLTAAKCKPSENGADDNVDSSSSSSSSSSSCSIADDVISCRLPTLLLNVKINVCRSPGRCLARLREKSLTLISFLLPALTFREEDFYDTTNDHLEYLIDLVVRGNQSVPSSDGDL